MDPGAAAETAGGALPAAQRLPKAVLFFGSTSILTLTLLNLIIAIMSDTYERVMTNVHDSDNK